MRILFISIRPFANFLVLSELNIPLVIGELPERIIGKGISGPGLLASILVDKYMDHLLLYHQRQRFLRENIHIAASTLEGWCNAALEKLQPLYNHLLEDTKAIGYLQANETGPRQRPYRC